MDSPIYEKWVEKEREQATNIAIIETTKKNIVTLAEQKFDFISKKDKEKIQSIEDLGLLNRLFIKTSEALNIEEFRELIDRAKQLD